MDLATTGRGERGETFDAATTLDLVSILLSDVDAHRALLEEVVSSHGRFRYDPPALAALFDEGGFAQGRIALHLALGQKDEALELVLLTQDAEAFGRLAKRKLSAENWGRVLAHLKGTNDLLVRTISPELIVDAMVEQKGAMAAIELLAREPEAVRYLPKAYFRLLHTLASAEAIRSRKLLSIFDSTVRSLSAEKEELPLPLLRLVDAELRQTQLGVWDEAALDMLCEALEGGGELQWFYEDAGDEWGVATRSDAASCPHCDNEISEGENIVLFRCGHIAHQQCCGEEACIVCYFQRKEADVLLTW
jgi:hypothetical protein